MIISHPLACTDAGDATMRLWQFHRCDATNPAPGDGGVATPRHLPHSIAFGPDGTLYVADRSHKRIQIFTPKGDFLDPWTGMGGPNDITRGKDGNFYIAEQEDDGKPAYVCVLAMRTGWCSPAWRAAKSTASASTRAAHPRRIDPGPQRRQVRASRLTGSPLTQLQLSSAAPRQAYTTLSPQLGEGEG